MWVSHLIGSPCTILLGYILANWSSTAMWMSSVSHCFSVSLSGARGDWERILISYYALHNNIALLIALAQLDVVMTCNLDRAARSFMVVWECSSPPLYTPLLLGTTQTGLQGVRPSCFVQGYIAPSKSRNSLVWANSNHAQIQSIPGLVGDGSAWERG